MTENREKLSSLIYRINKMLKRDLQEQLKPYGITTDQWMVLRRIYLSSGEYNQKELAEASFRERAAITRMVDIMEKKNLIERRNSPNDRREYLLYITPKGKAAYGSNSCLSWKGVCRGTPGSKSVQVHCIRVKQMASHT